MLAVIILVTRLIGSYTTVPAAEFSAGALAASETLEWLSAVFASAGIAVSVKELLKPRQVDIEKDIGKHIDWDDYDWGDSLDSPAAQDQIDELDKTINKLYSNASAKWKEMYEKSLSPTPTPETSPDKPDPSPPVTVAPVDPDSITPPNWETLKNMSKHNGFIPLEVGTFWCLKQAVSNWWESIMETERETASDDNKFSYSDCIGYQEVTAINANTKGVYNIKVWGYSLPSNPISEMKCIVMQDEDNILHRFSTPSGKSYDRIGIYQIYCIGDNYRELLCSDNNTSLPSLGSVSKSLWDSVKDSYHMYVPYTLDGERYEPEVKPMGKTGIWVNPDLKNDYDNNKSPSLPDTAPAPAIKIPSLDDLKDLQKKGNDASDDDRPSIILDWLKDHYTNPSTDPQPTTAPDPDPNPTTAPNPDPNPDPTTTPAVAPEISGSPNPSGTPDNPDGTDTDTDTDTDVDPNDYKTDLRLVFPFCIPFDLIYLIRAFEADPEAPVFEIPFDLELENPWTGKKVVDYHHTFKLDMSDYEPVIKIFRIFQIVFFIIGLLLITRQQMIKG